MLIVRDNIMDVKLIFARNKIVLVQAEISVYHYTGPYVFALALVKDAHKSLHGISPVFSRDLMLYLWRV